VLHLAGLEQIGDNAKSSLVKASQVCRNAAATSRHACRPHERLEHGRHAFWVSHTTMGPSQ